MDALKITGLRKTYASGAHSGKQPVEALRGVDLTVAEGDFYALLGANGAGKTTLINILVSLTTKSAGEVSVFGVDLDKDIDLAKSLIGVVPQEFNFSIFEKTRDIIITQAGYYGIAPKEAGERADELLAALGLTDKADTVSRAISGGMKRRLLIARALVHRPKLLILDEPTAGVDVELRRGMWDYLRQLNASGTTILLTTHYLEEVEQLCKNMTIIQNGAVVKTGPVKALLAESDARRYRFTFPAPLTEAQRATIGVDSVDGNDAIVALAPGETLDSRIVKAREAGASVVDVTHAHNRLEELYLSTLSK